MEFIQFMSDDKVNGLDIKPGIHFTENGSPIGVVFSKSQALALFRDIPSLVLVLCVDVPRALYVSNALEAIKFYQKEL